MSDIAEASRQYQIALEHERRGRGELGGVLSAQDDLTRAGEVTDRHRELIIDAMIAAIHS